MSREYVVTIEGVSGWREGGREAAVRDGIEAAARILAARGVDCRGALDLRDDAPAEIEVILAHVREAGRQTIKVPGPMDTPIPSYDGEEAPDPRLATPEGRLEAMKEMVAAGRIEVAPPERGGFVIQWSAENVGFGELAFSMGSDGAISVDDEGMSPEFVKAVFAALVARAALGRNS